MRFCIEFRRVEIKVFMSFVIEVCITSKCLNRIIYLGNFMGTHPEFLLNISFKLNEYSDPRKLKIFTFFLKENTGK